jgi:uncharacterized membrane protein (UPF0127 family)
MKPTRPVAAVLLLLSSLLASFAGATGPGDSIIPLSAFPREPIVVETRSARRHTFEAWRADSDAARAQGLMFIRDIRPDQAMIFVYEPPQMVAMWMKNTLMPLDMLFVDAAGCVVRTVHDARPGSLDTIAAGAPVALVVELKGGTTRALGIDAGDRVRRPGADWPADGLPCTGTR